MPRIGVTSVGDVDKTLLPEPVEVVTPVPPLATGRVPVTFVVKLTNVVDVEPVPPLATGKVPVTPVVNDNNPEESMLSAINDRFLDIVICYLNPRCCRFIPTVVFL